MSLISPDNEKRVKRLIYGTTVLICTAVLLLNQKWLPLPPSIPGWIYRLPALNALFNGSCAILLLVSLWAIKQKKIQLHKRLNLTAFVLSCLFLISYVTAHYFIPDTRYGDLNHNGIMEEAEKAAVSGIKPFYLILLLSHILLAIVVLPLVLLSFFYGLSDQRDKHRKLVRFSYPVWLYVTISGVVVYLMISPYYPY